MSIQKGTINSTRRGAKKNRKTGEEEDDSDYNEDDENESEMDPLKKAKEDLDGLDEME